MRHTSLLAVLVALGVATGCGSDTTAPSPPAGTYQLDRVNGGALPYLAENTSTQKLEIIAGSLSLELNGDFSAQVTSRQTQGSVQTNLTQRVDGTFTADGPRLTFTETTGDRYGGSVAGDRLTLQRLGITFDFVKQ